MTDEQPGNAAEILADQWVRFDLRDTLGMHSMAAARFEVVLIRLVIAAVLGASSASALAAADAQRAAARARGRRRRRR